MLHKTNKRILMCAGISTGEMFINDTHYEENIHAHEEAKQL